jgi:tripeptidyl-peptidase-1
VYQPESACEQLISSGFLYSGGGFSNHFSIPDYQKDAVQNYLKNYLTPGFPASYNSTGSRAHPDLSANGAKYAISVSKSCRHLLCLSRRFINYKLQGNFTRVYGTSASTPVVGAILTLINDARLLAGKKPIGFINPAVSHLLALFCHDGDSFQIYSPSFSDAFHDVTNGTNPGCGTLGFNAAKGWDPVTGNEKYYHPEVDKLIASRFVTQVLVPQISRSWSKSG